MRKLPVIIILLMSFLGLSGCRGDDLKATYFNARQQTVDHEDSVENEEIVNSDTNCSATNPHPMAESITETFEITYDEVMTIYCDGYAFSDILLALETSELVDQTEMELLVMLDTSTWEEIWKELGVESQQ